MATYIISVLNDPSTVGGTFAEGINDSGQVVGYYVDAGGHKHGFLYNGVTYTTLNYFVPHLYTGTDTVARDINDAGVIVGYTNVGISLGTTNPPSNIGGYTYSGGVFSLPISAANDTYTTGINNLSQITSYGADPFLNLPRQSSAGSVLLQLP